MKKIMVLDHQRDMPFRLDGIETMTAKQYLKESKWDKSTTVQLFNLCKSYGYQSRGYYVSLLAEARNHKVIPSVSTIQDIKTKSVVKVLSTDITDLIQKALAPIKSNEFLLSVYFGRNVAKQYDKLSAQLYFLFKVPLFRVKFKKNERWHIHHVGAISLNEIPESHFPFFESHAQEYFKKERFIYQKKETTNYDLAILINPNAKSAPSNEMALQLFEKEAEAMGFYTERLTKDDAHRISEFDALFIRETTSVNHHTYRIARRAEADGLIVIDDPKSIVRCANKVFLAENLTLAKVPTPQTLIIQNEKPAEIIAKLGLPVVLKLPDSSFSLGVKKAESKQALEHLLEKMLGESELVIAQRFMPTEYDWRIGILGNQVLYGCKYFMAKNHWQIYNWDSKEDEIEGKFETFAVDEIPAVIKDIALRAARKIGNGLYGVDIKVGKQGPFVIEINDNPNIDHGVEDRILGKELYKKIIMVFKKRIDQKNGLTLNGK